MEYRILVGKNKAEQANSSLFYVLLGATSIIINVAFMAFLYESDARPDILVRHIALLMAIFVLQAVIMTKAASSEYVYVEKIPKKHNGDLRNEAQDKEVII